VSAASPSLPAIPADLFCPNGAYNLRALTSARCPECGSSLERLRSGVSAVPWVRRGALGWFRAYWKTVLPFMPREKMFCSEMGKEVDALDSYRDVYRRGTPVHVKKLIWRPSISDVGSMWMGLPPRAPPWPCGLAPFPSIVAELLQILLVESEMVPHLMEHRSAHLVDDLRAAAADAL